MWLEAALDRDLRVRQPTPDDGARMWRLVRDMGGLELNSAYFYLLYCRDYARSCLIAETADELAGFVLGHRPPERPESLFVWQIGVAPGLRQRGVGRWLLQALIDRRSAATPDQRWTHLEASVSPDNRASRHLFRSVAQRHQVPCEVSPFLGAEQFPEKHPREDLLRIGPFPLTELDSTP
ncbi:MAG: diaminobutyrate acetyltransferase [Xanthomonadales bacterium]|nr:diaminobutyrate acetyltransferase [Xanthomonadales bacterium]